MVLKITHYTHESQLFEHPKPTTKLSERLDILINISTSKRGRGGCKKVDVVWLVHKLHTRLLKIRACKGHSEDM
jgi:hypothetical protein